MDFMILDRFKKGFEIYTPKSVDEIIDDIHYRTQRQKENNFALVYEPINYKKLKISHNQIIVQRQPGLFNPLTGFGTIFLDLESTNDGTKIKCSIDPLIRYYLGTFCIFSLVPIIMTLMLIFSGINLGSIIFILVTWIVFLLMGYFALAFNRFNLINYSKTILYDLGLSKSE
jgi:hypothetical protein